MAPTQTRHAGSGHYVEECMRGLLASSLLGRLSGRGITQWEQTVANSLSVAGDLTRAVVGEHRHRHRDGL